MMFARKKLTSHSTICLNDSLFSMQSILEHALTSMISLNMQLEAGISNVVADEGEFQDVVLNLALNARDAMPQGGQLSIATSSILLEQNQQFYSGNLPAGRYVKLSVTDTGHGMDKEVLSRIFEPFLQPNPLGRAQGLAWPWCLDLGIRRINAIFLNGQQIIHP